MNEFSEAPPEPPRADPIAGELVTETFDYDGGRQVTVYVPPDPPEANVFAGDGQMISQWGGFLEAAGVPSTMYQLGSISSQRSGRSRVKAWLVAERSRSGATTTTSPRSAT